MNRKVNVYESDNATKDLVYFKGARTSYGYDLDSDITEPSNYRNLLQCLESMEEGDSLDIDICCFGGYLHTTIRLINAIRNCKGHVHGNLNGVAMSGGSLILLACHSVSVQEHSELMAHTSLGGHPYQKLPDTLSAATSSGKQLNKLYHDVYKGFFTEEEINKILDGKDYYLLYDEICERLQNRSDMFSKEAMEAEQRNQQAMNDLFGDEEILPDEVLNKLTKAQLIQYTKGEIGIEYEQVDGKYTFTINNVEDIE
jgi:ATP-dependent protease ClpP protease subunit